MSNTFVKLGSVAEFINGAAFKPQDWGESGLRIIRIQNLTDPNKPFNRTERTVSELVRVQPGDLLVSWSATLGVFEWNDSEEALLNQHIFRVLPNTKIVDKRYLRHGLEVAILDMKKHLHGATMQHVNRGEFLSTKFYLPPLEEQKRIAEILDQAEELRRKRKEAIAQLDTLTQSIFLEMFGDPVKNPKGWNADKTLGEVADIVSGITKGRKLNGQSVREVPYLAVVNVQEHKLDLSVIKTIEATENEITRYRLEVNDLVLTEGGDPDKLGRGTIWKGELPECIHQNHIFRVRINCNLIHPLFLIWLIGSQRGKKYFLKQAKQTTGIATINMTQLRGFSLLLPPLSLQKEFAKRVEAVEELKKSHRASLSELDALFTSLQHRAFKGEL
ncbi:restriction endonuclease subunit S [Sphaerospermopsis sp. LEGE 00249]|uniref:restriction endonuclease subunit S n=1 Tax=Sphaerospermopsis sp. LEGE 00249 TaxID=1380707 RepID=UPI00164E38EE|nr:restriction endonuclease subunit S [Sphaerospermopsis sp. LEGE 00249]